MDGIQTRVYCPECGKELSLLLEKQETSGMIGDILKMMVPIMNASIGDETIYRGSIECSCGKTVNIRFSIETVSYDELLKPLKSIWDIQP